MTVRLSLIAVVEYFAQRRKHVQFVLLALTFSMFTLQPC